ncbi:MAG: TIGR04076 family protein [bacterium]|nr:TIGR04076 family protein [bacterium]
MTITKSNCRSGYHKQGDTFIVEDICPSICHELWNNIYPNVYTLLNGGDLDYGNKRAKEFDSQCPDGGRVKLKGEIIVDSKAL